MTRLEDLDGRSLSRYRLRLGELRAAGSAERRHFVLHLEGEGAPAGPVFSGIHSAGVPSRNIAAWIDGNYGGFVEGSTGDLVSLRDLGVEDPLFEALGSVIPPNGWLALAYETFGRDTPILEETRRLLNLSVPPIVTPLGLLLHRAGCGLNIRDWYIAEGWREGPRKLQGFKPANEESARRRTNETIEALRALVERSGGGPDVHGATQVAGRLLATFHEEG